jgi:hypothetical protein
MDKADRYRWKLHGARHGKRKEWWQAIESATAWATTEVWDVAAVEGMFLSRRRRAGLVPLLESAGYCLAACYTATEIKRPRALRWRAEVLGLGRGTDADAAEAAAVAYVGRRYAVPVELTKVERGAWCEAVCMAEYARGA